MEQPEGRPPRPAKWQLGVQLPPGQGVRDRGDRLVAVALDRRAVHVRRRLAAVRADDPGELVAALASGIDAAWAARPS